MNSWILPSITFTLKDNNPEILDFTLKHLRALNEAFTFPFRKKSSYKTKIGFQDTLPHPSSQFIAMLGILHLLILVRSRKWKPTPTKALSDEWFSKAGSQKRVFLWQRISSKYSHTSELLCPCNTFKTFPPSCTVCNLFGILNLIFVSCKLKWKSTCPCINCLRNTLEEQPSGAASLLHCPRLWKHG